MNLGPFEILVILVVAVLIFGSRLPEVGREIGKALTEFKRSLREVRDSTGIDDNLRDVRNFGRDARKIARSEYDPFGVDDFHSPPRPTEPQSEEPIAPEQPEESSPPAAPPADPLGISGSRPSLDHSDPTEEDVAEAESQTEDPDAGRV